MANLSCSLCAFAFLSPSHRAMVRRRAGVEVHPEQVYHIFVCNVGPSSVFRLLPRSRFPFPSSRRLARLPTSPLSCRLTVPPLTTTTIIHSRQPLQECLPEIKANVLAARGAHVPHPPPAMHHWGELPPVSASTLESARRGAVRRHATCPRSW